MCHMGPQALHVMVVDGWGHFQQSSRPLHLLVGMVFIARTFIRMDLDNEVGA